MKTLFRTLATSFAFTAVLAFAQTKPTFEAATIKPAAPIDQAKLIAAMQQGGKMPVGVNIGTSQAEYKYLDLRSLMMYAYGMKPYQITGPDWLTTTRFDITAKIPSGASRDDVNKMLQSLLEDRFKLTVHKTSAEHPVLALVVGKGGPKLKASTEKPVAIDENAELKPGQMKMDGPEGPIRMNVNPATGSAQIDMGLKGKMSYKVIPAKQAMQIDLSMVTMTGFADMMTQLLTQLSGGVAGRQIVDMTDIKGNYEASLEISLADMMALAKSAGMDIPGAPSGGAPAAAGGAGVASDPSGGAGSVTDAIQSMGLKLESRKAMVDQMVVDHIEKTPTEN